MLKLSQVAEELKISPITIRRYIKTGKLKASKVGREYLIAEEDLEPFLGKKDPLIEAHNLVSKALNDESEFQYHVSRKDPMHRARDIYHANDKKELAEAANMDANIFGYSYTNIFNESESRKRWGRFAPTGTARNKDGKEYYFPDPGWIDERMISHVKNRLLQTKNPITLSIYNDLIFEHSVEKGKHLYAKEAISNYLLAAKIQLKNGWMFEFLDSVVRALELAIILKDKPRVTELIKLIFEYIEVLNKQGKSRYSLELLEVLVEFLTYLEEDQIQNIITAAYSGAGYFGGLKEANHHIQRSFLDVIKSIHHVQKNPKKEKQVILEQAESFLEEANAKAGNGLVEAHFLEEALTLLRQAGDPKNLEPVLLKKIEEAYLKSQDEMKMISIEYKITDKQREDFVNSVFVESNEESLARIGAHPQLIPSVKHAETLAKEIFEKYPMSQIFAKNTIQDGRKITSTKGGLEVNEDHIIENLGRSVESHAIFLGFLFQELKRRNIGAKELLEYLKDKPLFNYDNFEALAEGVESFEEGKYFQALSTLVPQVEEILRSSLRSVGYPTIKIDRSGYHQAIKIAEILEAPPLKSFLSEDLYWYFRLVMYDKRGSALRDQIAHGLLKKSSKNQLDAYLTMHLVLILATFSIKQNK